MKLDALERTLTMWEDTHFLFEYFAKSGRRHRVDTLATERALCQNWSNLRASLKQRNKPAIPFDHDRYTTYGYSPENDNEGLSLHRAFPYSLSTWMSYSRRVFLIGPAIQQALDVISFGDVQTKDIELPFESFAVKLTEPLRKDDGSLVSTFLITPFDELAEVLYGPMEGLDNARTYAVWAFPDSPSQYMRIRDDHRKKMLKGGLKADQIAARLRERNMYKLQNGVGVQVFNIAAPYPIEDLIGVFNDSAIQAAFRAIFHTCLIMEGLPPQLKRQVMEKAEESRKDIIEKELMEVGDEDLFKIQSLHLLKSIITPSKSDGDPSYELGPHWRRKHWRRPPGLGSDPTAEKTVKVNPTLVRADRLLEGILPTSGATQLREGDL